MAELEKDTYFLRVPRNIYSFTVQRAIIIVIHKCNTKIDESLKFADLIKLLMVSVQGFDGGIKCTYGLGFNLI